jgi:hypothetical protein
MMQIMAKLKHRTNFFFALLGFILVLTASAQTPHVMSWDAYSRNSYRWPYILNIYTPHGGLFYFGVQHSDDPNDEQFKEIEAFWRQFDPDVAFYEGPELTVAEKTRNEAIHNAGERGLVRYLAGSQVAVSSMEPKLAEEVAELLKKYRPEQIKTFYVIRNKVFYDGLTYPNETLEQYLQDTITQISVEAALKSVRPHSIGELQSTFADNFPDLGSYKNVPARWVDPAQSETKLNEISRASAEFRDQIIVAKISDAVCKQKRVFAVVGASHVVMQEPAIRAFLSEKCSQ